MSNTLIRRIEDIRTNACEQFPTKKKWTFTLESGRGQTYNSGEPTLYAHNVYGPGSVLKGRERRVYVEAWSDWDAARKALAEVKEGIKGFKYDDFGPEGGTTHIDVNVLTAHLPDNDGE